MPAPPRPGGTGARGDTEGHPVQPAREGITLPDRSGRPGQDKERGLKRVLGIVMIAQDGMTDSLDHRPVPFHQRRERQLVTPGDEHLKQVPVAHSGDRPGLEEEAQLAPRRGAIDIVHGLISRTPSFPIVVR